MMIKAAIHRVILTATALLAAPVLQAQAIPDNLLRGELLGGWRTETGTQMAALHLVMAPGWKTYWRAPGESGIPPRFDWQGSENIAATRFHWPRPELFDINGLRTIGYKNELVLPIELTPADADAPMTVVASIELGVCDEICVPVTLDLSVNLLRNGPDDSQIRAALAKVPEPAAKVGLRAAKCAAEPIRDGLRLTSTLTMPQLGPAEFAVIELADQTVWVSTAKTTRNGAELTSVADLVPANARPFSLNRSDVRITVFGGAGRVADVQGCTG